MPMATYFRFRVYWTLVILVNLGSLTSLKSAADLKDSQLCKNLKYEDLVIILDTSSLDHMPQEFDKMKDLTLKLVERVTAADGRAHVLLMGKRFEILGIDPEAIQKRLTELQPDELPQKDDEPKSVGSFDASFAFAPILQEIDMKKSQAGNDISKTDEQSINLLPIFEQFASSEGAAGSSDSDSSSHAAGIFLFSTFLTPLPSSKVVSKLHDLSTFLLIDNGCGAALRPASSSYLASSPDLSFQVTTFTDPKTATDLLSRLDAFMCDDSTTPPTSLSITTTTTDSPKFTSSRNSSSEENRDDSGHNSTRLEQTTSSEENSDSSGEKRKHKKKKNPSFKGGGFRIVDSFEGEQNESARVAFLELMQKSDIPSIKGAKGGSANAAPSFSKNGTEDVDNQTVTSDLTTPRPKISKIPAHVRPIKTSALSDRDGQFPAKFLIISLLICLLLGIIIAVAVLLARGRKRRQEQLEAPIDEYGTLARGGVAGGKETESLSLSSNSRQSPVDVNDTTALKADTDEVELG